MNNRFNFTDEQKRAFFVALITFILAVASIMGYDYAVVQPREAGSGATVNYGSRAAGGIETLKSLRITNLFQNQGTMTQSGAATFEGAVTFNGTTSLAAASALADGTAAAPAQAFTNDTDCGIYRIGTNNIGFAANGTAAFDYNASTLDVDNLTISDSDSAVTIADTAIVDGAADGIQLTVQGYTTQTNDLFVVETSAGSDYFSISRYGYPVMAGVNSAGSGADLIKWSGTLGAMNGSDTTNIVLLDPTNANHTGSYNYLYGLNVDDITGDAQATEVGVRIDTGWDYGIQDRSGSLLASATITGAATIGGGYGYTGCTVTSGGALSCNGDIVANANFTVTATTGAVKTDSSLTADSCSVGGGYGSSGVSISNAGAVSANGNLAVNGNFTVTAASGNVATDGGVDVATSALTFGTDNLYALGYASDARAVVCNTAQVTGTKTVSSGADTFEYGTCSMGEAPGYLAAANGYAVWCTISGGDLAITVVTSKTVTSNETNVAINYCVVSDTQP